MVVGAVCFGLGCLSVLLVWGFCILFVWLVCLVFSSEIAIMYPDWSIFRVCHIKLVSMDKERLL